MCEEKEMGGGEEGEGEGKRDREWVYHLYKRGLLANAPKENIYFKHSSPLGFAAKV